MIAVTRNHFLKAAHEIGRNGENDTLPYDMDATFIRDKAADLSDICFELFQCLEKPPKSKNLSTIDSFTIGSERLLVPSGSHGFRMTTRIHPFWNLYLNGLGLALAEANESRRSARAHSYRLGRTTDASFFDSSKSWKTYKEATLREEGLKGDDCVVIQTDISSFYEHVNHHRLENLIDELAPSESTVASQIIRILAKLSSGRSFGLPVGGQCARILAEVMMTPIDQSLSDAGLVWHRYVDDFTIISKSQQDAYVALSLLSNALSDYGLSLIRTKTTILKAAHYAEFVATQLGHDDSQAIALSELDLHFDPYSDEAKDDYAQLKKSLEVIDIKFLLDLEKEKSQPDTFVVTQIGRALKFQEPKIAVQLCATLLDARNLNSFRASWSKIMRGIYSVRANPDFESIYDEVDDLLDSIPLGATHLLVPEVNALHYLRAIRFRRTDARGRWVRQTYDRQSPLLKRACVDCWRHWNDRASFTRLRNQWQNLDPDQQRMVWVAAGRFGDDGEHARRQLGRSLGQAWRLGFEKNGTTTFASCYVDWAKNAS